jgi:hypothetical protein
MFLSGTDVSEKAEKMWTTLKGKVLPYRSERTKIRELVRSGTVRKILLQDLGMRMLAAELMPRN